MRKMIKLAALPLAALALAGTFATSASAESVGDFVTDTFTRTGIDADQPAGAVAFALYIFPPGGDGSCTAANLVYANTRPIAAGVDSVTSLPYQITASGSYGWVVSFTGTTDHRFDIFKQGCGDPREHFTVYCPPVAVTTPRVAGPGEIG